MTLSELIEAYGYWIVFAGTLFEGESVLLLAGYAAYSGLLELHWVIALATLGGFLGDQLWYFLGRRHGARVLARFPKYAAPARRAEQLLHRYNTPIILAVRFLYGLRIVLPFAIGMNRRISTLRFQILNLIGAVLWSAIGAIAGYLFGNAIEYILGDLKKYELYVFAALLIGGVGYWWISRKRASR
jgi:membrane protein DedA with SNARE-associated domain